MMFCGLMSRWITPRWCANSRCSSTCSISGAPPFARRSQAKLSPHALDLFVGSLTGRPLLGRLLVMLDPVPGLEIEMRPAFRELDVILVTGFRATQRSRG